MLEDSVGTQKNLDEIVQPSNSAHFASTEHPSLNDIESASGEEVPSSDFANDKPVDSDAQETNELDIVKSQDEIDSIQDDRNEKELADDTTETNLKTNIGVADATSLEENPPSEDGTTDLHHVVSVSVESTLDLTLC